MKQSGKLIGKNANRRSFLKGGMVAAGAAVVGGGILAKGLPTFGKDSSDGPVTKGDIAISKVPGNAFEQIGSRPVSWTQYAGARRYREESRAGPEYPLNTGDSLVEPRF